MNANAPITIACECGAVQGSLSTRLAPRAVICYCKDCQAFARFLQRADPILDDQGGTLILQTEPRFLRFTRGADNIACVRLTPKGISRWYASCCRTAIGNTLPTIDASFVGIIHDCVTGTVDEIVARLGPVRVFAHTQSALGTPKPEQRGVVPALMSIGWQLLRGRVTGNCRKTPFFDAASGRPVAEPHGLTREELEAARIS